MSNDKNKKPDVLNWGENCTVLHFPRHFYSVLVMSDGTPEDRHSDSSDGPSVLVLASPEPPTVAAESDADASTTAYDAPRPDATTAPADDDDAVSVCDSSSVVARGLSSMISSVIRDFDARAEETVRSQDQLSFAIDRLTRGIIQPLLVRLFAGLCLY